MRKITPLLSILDDGSTESTKFDQPTYFQILSWVDHQSAAALQKRATRAFFYDTLVKSPDTMRLKLLEVKLAVRQIVPVMGVPKDGKPQPLLTHEGKPIYEVRGVSQESGSNLYFGMVTDLPAGTPVGTLINDDAVLVGYFFKVQGYVSQQQQLDFEASRTKRIVPLKAPLIIGRLIWLAEPTASVASTTPVPVLVTGGAQSLLSWWWVGYTGAAIASARRRCRGLRSAGPSTRTRRRWMTGWTRPNRGTPKGLCRTTAGGSWGIFSTTTANLTAEGHPATVILLSRGIFSATGLAAASRKSAKMRAQPVRIKVIGPTVNVPAGACTAGAVQRGTFHGRSCT